MEGQNLKIEYRYTGGRQDTVASRVEEIVGLGVDVIVAWGPPLSLAAKRVALDDHNVERFCNLLHDMTSSTETRFIIITHNPITMARMNRLFGVTMAERGVSQLVSVGLDDAVKILDQDVA